MTSQMLKPWSSASPVTVDHLPICSLSLLIERDTGCSSGERLLERLTPFSWSSASPGGADAQMLKRRGKPSKPKSSTGGKRGRHPRRLTKADREALRLLHSPLDRRGGR